MKAFKYIIMAIALTLVSASCSTARYSAFAPSQTQLSIQMSDLEYLGESEISVEYRQYLGLFTATDVINGEAFTGEQINRFPIYSNQVLLPKLDLAAYKLSVEFPNADYFVVTSQTKERYQLFLGSQVAVKAKVKAYSFKK